MYHEAFETDTEMQKWDAGCWIRYKMFEQTLKDAPTAEPVRHGHWTKRWYPDGSKIGYECSLCYTHWDGETNYCPHCGAKMDLEGEK